MSRLLIWTENYWIGGCDRFLVDLVSGLRDHPVEIVLAGNRHPEFDAWLAERVPDVMPRIVVDVLNQRESPLAKVKHRVPGAKAAEATALAAEPGVPGFSLFSAGGAVARYEQAARNLRRLRRLVRRVRPDAVLINNGGYPGGHTCRVMALAAHAEGVSPVVHFVHNMAYPPEWPQALERRYDRRIDRATDVWVTAAHRASAALQRERGLTREPATVHYGIAPAAAPADVDLGALRQEIGYADGAVNIAVVANFEPRKGHLVLLDALAALREVAFRCALVGGGDEREVLEHRVRELGLENRVRFLGWRPDVDAILSASDLLVLPSLANECLPYAILEAMGHGLPVVATDVAGIPEEVDDGVTGHVVVPGDAPALAAAIADLCADADRRRAMGEAGRRRLEGEFSLTRMVEEMAELCGLPRP